MASTIAAGETSCKIAVIRLFLISSLFYASRGTARCAPTEGSPLVRAGEQAPLLRRLAADDADRRRGVVAGRLHQRQAADGRLGIVLHLLLAGRVATPPGLEEAAVLDLALEVGIAADPAGIVGAELDGAVIQVLLDLF